VLGGSVTCRLDERALELLVLYVDVLEVLVVPACEFTVEVEVHVVDIARRYGSGDEDVQFRATLAWLF
jgi:hypothetical protein